MLTVISKSCYISNSTNDITQHNSTPYNMTCQWYSHLSAMNTSIPTALSSLSQKVWELSSLNVIALQMIKLISKIMAIFYAFGFCVTILALVGFLGSPGGRMRTMISAMLSCVSRTHTGLATLILNPACVLCLWTGLCIRHVSDISQPAYHPRIRARQWDGDFYREIIFGVELDNSGHDADCKFRWNIVRFDSYLEYT